MVTEYRDGPDAYRTEAELVIARTVELCAVPAPPLREADRAAVVLRWWRDDGLDPFRDDVGNVWARLRPGAGPALLVAAHLDTVFGPEVPHRTVREGDRLVGPGVGDDTVAVAALSSLHRLLPAEFPVPLWIVATVGEEGLGNLKGMTAALDAPPQPVAALIALEGNYLGRVTTTGVGSHRLAVTVHGPGGHAWEDADTPSAVHVAAALIHRLDRLPRPDGRTSLNVGTVTGGTSINARAGHCAFQLDLRAERQAALDALVAGAERVLADPAHTEGGIRVDTEVIGRRPAGGIPASHPLVRTATAALSAAGLTPRLTAASTDANAAYARGIPAVTLGITTGDLTHTESEWIDLPPVPTGLAVLTRTLTDYAATLADPKD